MEAQTKKSLVRNGMERRENWRNQTKTKKIKRNTDTERMKLEKHDKQTNFKDRVAPQKV